MPCETSIRFEVHTECLRALNDLCGSVKMPNGERLLLYWEHSYGPTMCQEPGEYEHQSDMYAAACQASDFNTWARGAVDIPDVGDTGIRLSTYSAEENIFKISGFDLIRFGVPKLRCYGKQGEIQEIMSNARITSERLPHILAVVARFRVLAIENLLVGKEAFSDKAYSLVKRLLEIEYGV